MGGRGEQSLGLVRLGLLCPYVVKLLVLAESPVLGDWPWEPAITLIFRGFYRNTWVGPK